MSRAKPKYAGALKVANEIHAIEHGTLNGPDRAYLISEVSMRLNRNDLTGALSVAWQSAKNLFPGASPFVLDTAAKEIVFKIGKGYTTSKMRGLRENPGAQRPPDLDSPTYQERERRPKWNVKVSPLMDADEGGRMLRRRLPQFSKADHEAAAQYFAAERKGALKKWNGLIEREHKRVFGRPYEATDYKISGIGRDEYSEDAKKTLRYLAHFASAAGAAAAAHWKAAGRRTRMQENPRKLRAQRAGELRETEGAKMYAHYKAGKPAPYSPNPGERPANWIVTADYTEAWESDYAPRFDFKTMRPSYRGAVPKRVKIWGPRGAAMPELTALPLEFLMADDDGVIYYGGFANERAEFEPLDMYGEPNAGAVSIVYKRGKTWEML